jgi:hypothetical protein
MITLKTIIVGAALAISLAAFVFCLAHQCYVAMRRVGFGMILAAAAFLHSMASKPPAKGFTIYPSNISATNIVWQIHCPTNFVGEFAQFKYLEQGSDVEYLAGPAFVLSTTNLVHTLDGNYIHSGRVRQFHLEVDTASSNNRLILPEANR